MAGHLVRWRRGGKNVGFLEQGPSLGNMEMPVFKLEEFELFLSCIFE